jgi:TATA-binding protein-associated factor
MKGTQVNVYSEVSFRIAGMSEEQRVKANERWLDDCSLRLLSVLALDRFCDYVGDKVVAPVRETCAQALSAVVNHMNFDSVRKVIQILLQLSRSSQWECRQAGFLGIQYVLAIRRDIAEDLLVDVLPAIQQGYIQNVLYKQK